VPKLEIYRQRARSLLSRSFETPIINLLSRVGVTPNQLTALGLLVSIGAAFLATQGHFLEAGITLAVAGILDLLDGGLARATGKSSSQGALLDSLADRISEIALLLGILIYYVCRGSDFWWQPVLVYLALANGFLVSYLRARSESLGITAKVGVMTRSERVLVLIIGLLLGWIEVALAVITIMSIATWMHRFINAWNSLGKAPK
jgi:CDP-diacylglycerol--glycerol-3-phosphate 3-phosphatidyltransferase